MYYTTLNEIQVQVMRFLLQFKKHLTLFNGQKNKMVRKFHSSFSMQLLCITVCTIKKTFVSLAEALTDLSISNFHYMAVFFFLFLLRPDLYGKSSNNKKCTLIIPDKGWQILAVLGKKKKM